MSDRENEKRTRLTQSVLVKYGQRANHSIDYDQNQGNSILNKFELTYL